jgi:hypothetical protein
MNFNWLFGPRLSRDNPPAPEILVIRSVVTDLDTVREVAERIDTRFIDSKAKFWVLDRDSTAEPREVAADQLQTISAADRARLYVETFSPDCGNMRVELRNRARPFIRMTPCEPDFMDGVAKILLDSGRPRVRWSRFVRYTLAIPFLALLGAWIWLTIVAPLPVPGLVFGWLIVVFALGGTVALTRRPFLKLVLAYPGHKIRNETRMETYARRADGHKNVKVAFITAPITIAATLLVAWISGFLHLTP